MTRKLRMGMVGGGQGAFIGGVHRIAANIDGQIELVCGAFSSDPARSKASGKELYLAENRCYANFEEMMTKEAALPTDQRMELVSIVTPNHMHFPPAKLALENGFHVICDKPVTLNLEEAIALRELVHHTGLLFALTHNYTGYPMVQQARKMARSGDLGKIRKIVVEYPQGWLATPLEKTGQKQASWRIDPKKSGAGGCMGDVGTHAENLAEFITGLRITEMCADLTAFGEDRILDDDGNILLRFEKGAKGILHASQISVGEENNLNIRIYGETGGIEWHQVEPNTLLVKSLDGPTQIFRTSGSYLSKEAAAATRLPAGHPEGYLEAFANLYKNFAADIQAVQQGKKPTRNYPSIDDGVRGMAFIETAVKSAANGAVWTPFPNV